MTEPRPNEPNDAPEPPLRLAETGHDEGSTHPVPDAAGSSLDASARSGTAGQEGVSTGGFETMLGRIVIQRGLATPEEVQQCSALLREIAGGDSDEPRTLSDLLIDNEFLTRRQLDRLRSEFDAKKSTKSIPGYRIKEKLGSGAMATVFLARQLSLDRLVAIKVLPQKFSDNDKFIERFYKEGRAAAQLNHPNIVAAYDVGKAGEHHYFVMEYVDGESVYDRLVKDKRFEEMEALEIVRQVALALQHAHERGFIHRDIKPKNIMISKRGKVKLADLGLARAVTDKEAAQAEAGRAYGTPYYISPEQIRGEVNIGPPADLYGLGATMYHMVTARVPFEGKNPSAVMHKHLKSELTPPDHVNPEISNGTAQIIEMLMEKDPRDRYHTAADLLEDVERVLRGEAPKYARGGVDFAHLEEAIANAETAPPPPTAANRGRATDSPFFMILLIVMLVSLLVNVVLVAILAT